MCEGIPDAGSDYADEGTAAHFLAAYCLKEGADPLYSMGRFIHVHPDGECTVTQDGAGEGNVFKIDDEMAGNVRRYVACVKGYGGDLMVEQSLDIGFMTGEAGAKGTSDAVIFDTVNSQLVVVDLKYGRGEPVSAERNKQLMIYALAALEMAALIGFDPASVRLVIHQPRVADHPQEWVCSVDTLREFEAEVREAAAACHAATASSGEWIDVAPMEYLKPSEKGCRWCLAKPDCDAAAAEVTAQTSLQFDVLPAEEPAAQLAAADAATLGQKFAAVGWLEDWCKAVRAEVERRLLAGEEVGGTKLVQGKRGNRQWVSDEDAEKLLKEMRIKQDVMYTFKVISPTAAEKAFKAGDIGPRQWPKLQALITQAEGKPSVALADDPRPALVRGPAAFDVLPPDDGSDLC